MLKRFNKKGDTSAWGVIFGIALAAFVVFMIVWAGLGYFDVLSSPTDVDIDLTVMEQACTNSLTLGKTQYCVGSYEVSTNRYIGCVYAKDVLGMNIDENIVPLDCGTDKEIAKKICLKIALGDEKYDEEKVYVNGELCIEHMVAAEVAASLGTTSGTGIWSRGFWKLED